MNELLESNKIANTTSTKTIIPIKMNFDIIFYPPCVVVLVDALEVVVDVDDDVDPEVVVELVDEVVVELVDEVVVVVADGQFITSFGQAFLFLPQFGAQNPSAVGLYPSGQLSHLLTGREQTNGLFWQ